MFGRKLKTPSEADLAEAIAQAEAMSPFESVRFMQMLQRDAGPGKVVAMPSPLMDVYNRKLAEYEAAYQERERSADPKAAHLEYRRRMMLGDFVQGDLQKSLFG